MRPIRNLLVAAVAFLGIVGSAASIQAQENACQSQIDAVEQTASRITAKYRPQLDQLSADSSQRAQQIQDDNPEPSAVGAVVKFDIRVSSHDEVIIFDLPSVTMRTQTISFDLPSVTTRRVEWSWDIPETRMEQRCIPGVPETVCDSGAAPECRVDGFNVRCSGGRPPSCSIRAGAQICTDVPVVRMITQTASLDIPELAMRRQEAKLDLPQFEMVEQRMVIRVPDFTLVNVEAATEEMRKESQELEADVKLKSATVSSQMKAEIKTEMASKMADVFSCNEGQLVGQRDKALLEMDNQIAEFSSRASIARSQKNEEVAKGIDASVSLLVTARKDVGDKFDMALADLRSKRDLALADNIAK